MADPGASHVFVMRHGKTDMNAAGIIQGRLPAALTEEGRASVRRHGAYLAGLGLDGWRVLCGPTKRTRESADVVLSELPAPLEVVDSLGEIGRGLLEGHAKRELPPSLAAAYGAFLADPWHVRPPGDGAESFADVEARLARDVVPAIRERSAPGRPLAVVTHGSVGKILVMLLAGLGRDWVSRVPGKHDYLHHLATPPAGAPGAAGPPRAVLTVRDGASGYGEVDWRSRPGGEAPEA